MYAEFWTKCYCPQCESPNWVFDGDLDSEPSRHERQLYVEDNDEDGEVAANFDAASCWHCGHVYAICYDDEQPDLPVDDMEILPSYRKPVVPIGH